MCGKPKPRATGFRRERNLSAGFGSAPAVSWRRRRTPVRKNKFAGERREASYLWRGSTPWRKLRFRLRRVLLPWRQCGYDLCGQGRPPPYQWECRHHPCRRDSRCAGDEQYGRRRRFGSGFGILGGTPQIAQQPQTRRKTANGSLAVLVGASVATAVSFCKKSK